MASEENSVLLYNKSLIGFDALFTAACIAASTNYPPYNVINYDNSVYTIEIAIAGFKKSDIKVSLTGNQLNVTGTRNVSLLPAGHIYMHRGLAFRDFEKTFALAENIEIRSATIEDGLLSISLYRNTPSTTLTRQIEIN